jgi:polar amino acid transport system substrate-binding protein
VKLNQYTLQHKHLLSKAVLGINLVMLVVAALGAMSAHAADLPERIKKAGKLVIATQANYPPIAYKNPETGELQGLDIELGAAIARELGLKVEYQETSFAQVFSSLATGRVDIAMVAISDTAERQKVADFIDYMKTGPQFFTLQSHAARIKGIGDVCGTKVGASRNTNWPVQIAAWSSDNCVAKGKPAITVIGTEGSVDARTQLKTGRIDVAVQGSETLPYFQNMEANTYVLLGQPLFQQETGIPIAKTEPVLRAAVMTALQNLQRNGTYDKLLAKYKLQSSSMPAALNQGK